jgi:hypothetical protein
LRLIETLRQEKWLPFFKTSTFTDYNMMLTICSKFFLSFCLALTRKGVNFIQERYMDVLVSRFNSILWKVDGIFEKTEGKEKETALRGPVNILRAVRRPLQLVFASFYCTYEDDVLHNFYGLLIFLD